MLKKIFYFIGGFFVVPIMIGTPLAYITSDKYEEALSYIGGIYLLTYILFPIFYRPVKKFVSNKFIFFILMYIPFIIIYFFK